MKKQTHTAFSLIELSIVLIVMGILIAGVVGGFSLIDSTKVTSTYSEMRELNTMAAAFRARYEVLPGDMNNARAIFPDGNWDDAENSKKRPTGNKGNGNADGFIGGSAPFYMPSVAEPEDLNSSGDPLNIESINFFYHLRLAEILMDDYEGDVPMSFSAINLNKKHYPEIKLGSEYFYYFISGNDKSVLDGRYGRETRIMIGSRNGGGMSPRHAAKLDVKFDDGNPFYGSIIAGSRMDFGI